jgi:hypothetical protein
MTQIEYAKQMAAIIMKQYKDSMVVMKYASHLEQDKLIQPETVEEAQKSVLPTGIMKLVWC